jgi:hypothetical protein
MNTKQDHLADEAGLFGCGACGTYARLLADDVSKCGLCGKAPLIRVDDLPPHVVACLVRQRAEMKKK